MTQSSLIAVESLRAKAVYSNGYYVTPFPDQGFAREIVNPRRGATLSLPLADWKQQATAQRLMFEEFGLHDLAQCTTAEMRKRPVPHVFKEVEVEALTQLFAEWAPRIYARLLPEMKAPIQVFNKTSRLGWPEFRRVENKREVLQPYFDMILNEGVDWMRDAFVLMNVRLQAESPKKERDYLFVTDGGRVYPETVSASQREVKTPIGKRYASRTRLVFNLPVSNLLTQIFDTAIHDVELSYPVFHHDMYSMAMAGKLPGSRLFFDVKHFERHTSGVVRLRSDIVGGLYGSIGALSASLPFLCPSDTRRTRQLLWPARDQGYTDQFASGNSAVAPAQKEVFLALYAEFAKRAFGLDPDRAITWVLGGGDHKLRILNYGDDNATSGDAGVLRELMPFLTNYLHVEEEEPAKFLGFLYTDSGWRLGVRSYLEKTYLNERAPGGPGRKSFFRKYPCYGWVQKRENYAKYGLPELTTTVFPFENSVLYKVGIPWAEVQARAVKESLAIADLGGLADLNWILGKDYLMKPEEKLATGMFDGMDASETGPLLKSLLSKEWKGKLRW